MEYQRARTDEQINDRIYEIVDAAKQIYDEFGYEGLNFSRISAYTNFTRPNIYKYFRTKDEILLVILKDEYEKYMISFISKFEADKEYSAKEIAQIWVEVFIENKYFIEIYSLLYMVIEKNSSVEALIEFKSDVMIYYDQFNTFLNSLLPNIDIEKISFLARDVLVAAYGFYSMINKNENQEKAHSVILFDKLQLSFKETLVSRIYKDIYCLQNNIE